MNSPALRELLRPALFVNSILWFTLTASIVIYGVVAHLLAQQNAGPTSLAPAVQMAFTGAAILAGLVSLMVPRFLLSDDRVRQVMQPDAVAEKLAVTEEQSRKIQELSDSERKLLRLPTLYFTPFILRLVLNEFVAICGFVLAFMSHSLGPFLPFAAAAIALNIICRPQIDPLLERAARLAY